MQTLDAMLELRNTHQTPEKKLQEGIIGKIGFIFSVGVFIEGTREYRIVGAVVQIFHKNFQYSFAIKIQF